MGDTITLETKITKGKHKGKTVSEALDEEKSFIFDYIKNGYDIDDDVLMKAHIKHIKRDETAYSDFKKKVIPFRVIDDNDNNERFKLPKDKMSVEKIIKELEYDKEMLDDMPSEE